MTVNEAALLMDRFDRLFEDLRRKVEELFSWVPDFLSWVVKPFQAAWDKLCDLCGRLWEEIADFFTDPGDPGRLNDAAKTFSDKVQAGVSAQAGKFTETYMRVDDKWKGDAAEEYRKVLAPNAPQSSALRQYATTVLEVSKALNSARWALIVFWVAFCTSAAIMIGGVVALIAGLVSVVGTVPTILAYCGLVGQFLISVTVAATYAISEMSEAAGTFRTQNNGNDHLAGGEWPPSGVAAS